MGLGYNLNTFTPCIPGLYWNKSSSDSDAVNNKDAVVDAKQKRKEQAAELLRKHREHLKQIEENRQKIQEQIEPLKSSQEELAVTINKAKSGKQSSDGTIKAKETWGDYKKLSTWKKMLRAGSQLIQGGWKAATSLVGYETDKKTGERKWNPVKLCLNAAIAAGCIAACACTWPVSLPLIGATTVGAAVTGTLLAVGGAIAVGGIAKGVVGVADAIKKKDVAALDSSCQDVGEGVTIGVATLAGARSVGASLETTAASNSAAAIARTTSAGSYARLSNFLTRTEYVKGGNKFSQYFYDSTINAARSIAHSGRKGRLDYTNKGFWKSSWENAKDFIPKNGKSKMTKEQNAVNNAIDTRLAKIQQELQEPNLSVFKKSLLQSEQRFLNAQKNELANTVTRNAWNGLKKKSKSHKELENLKNSIEEFENQGFTNINGRRYNMSEENLSALQQASDRAKQISKQIEHLVKVRKSTIKNMAYLKRYKSEVEAYTTKTRNNRFRRFFDVRKIQKDDITFWNVISSPFKAALWALGLEFKPWTYVQKSPASTVYKAQEIISPEYEEGMLTTGFFADVLDMGEKTLKTKITMQNENGEMVEQEVEVTKELLSKFNEQKKQIDEELMGLNKQLNQLYTA